MTPDTARGMWRRAIDRNGGDVSFRRVSPVLQVTAKAVPRGYEPSELTGGIQMGDREFRVMAEDLDAVIVSPTLRNGDKVFYNGRLLNIERVDASTVSVGGETIAYIVTARG